MGCFRGGIESLPCVGRQREEGGVQSWSRDDLVHALLPLPLRACGLCVLER